MGNESLASNPPPVDWPRLSSAVFYRDAPRAIDFLCKAFGFRVRLRIDGEGGRIQHSELVFGDGLIMVGSEGGRSDRPDPLPGKSPLSAGGANTQCLCLFVDDADAHCAHARAAGALIIDPPETHDHGPEYWADRSYRAADVEGHHWFFMQRVRDPAPRR